MKETNDKALSALTSMTSDVNVGMDEVVSVFVSRYETQLFEKKDEVGSNIKFIRNDLSDLDNRLIASIDKEQYNTSIATLNITTKVDEIGVRWGKKENYINVEVEVKDADKNQRYSSSFTKNVKVKIMDGDVKLHNDLDDNLENLKTELAEVMGLIKAVSRKERQVRGRISEMKLQESGFAGLLDSPELTKLVQL